MGYVLQFGEIAHLKKYIIIIIIIMTNDRKIADDPHRDVLTWFAD